MPRYLHTEADLDAALAKLVLADPRLAPVLATAGRPPLRRREGGFTGLCTIVIGQQLSVASAAAIRGRVMAAFDPFHHDNVRRARADKLARLGLSAAKIRTLKAIGTAVSRGDINLEALGAMDADDAHDALIKLHGIGPWTADIYLMVCLGHADAWPSGDLALQEAARLALNLRSRPDAKKMIKLAQIWRPYRAVAAHLLWKYYGVVKGREGAPVASAASSAKKSAKNSVKKNGGKNGRTRRPAARTARR
jgi:DNA-3-methyladenine glycosylase II